MDEARTISSADWHQQVSALERGSRSSSETIKDRLLKRMDKDSAKSFSEVQLRELERVLSSQTTKRPPIDIRITVPFFWQRVFVTFLAGPERRSAERLRRDRAKHAIFTFANVCFFVFLLLLFIPTFIGLVHILAVGNV